MDDQSQIHSYSPQKQGFNKEVTVILLLILIYPIGLVFMWLWMNNWVKWFKILLTSFFFIPIVLGITFVVSLNKLNSKNNIKQAYYTTPPSPTKVIECKDHDVRICADGTQVTKTPPGCNYTACEDIPAQFNEMTNWRKYKINTLQLTFELPPELDRNYIEEKVFSDTGYKLCFAENKQVLSIIPKAYAAGIGLCNYVPEDYEFLISSPTKDFTAGREGGFADFSNFYTQNNEYTVSIAMRRAILPPNSASIYINRNGIHFLIVTTHYSTSYGQEYVTWSSPPEGWIGALANLKYDDHPGMNILMKLNGRTEEDFKEILNTINYIEK